MFHTASLPSGWRRIRTSRRHPLKLGPSGCHQPSELPPIPESATQEEDVGNDEVPIGEKVTGIPLLASKNDSDCIPISSVRNFEKQFFICSAGNGLRSAPASLRTAAGSDGFPPGKAGSVACACSSCHPIVVTSPPPDLCNWSVAPDQS